MELLFLTKTGGILGPFAVVLGWIINYIYKFLELIGIPNIGLVIILFTLIVNLILLPMTIKQQKYTKLSAVMNPEIQKIQAKYKGKKDEVSMRRMQAETQAVYQKIRYKYHGRMPVHDYPAAHSVCVISGHL